MSDNLWKGNTTASVAEEKKRKQSDAMFFVYGNRFSNCVTISIDDYKYI